MTLLEQLETPGHQLLTDSQDIRAILETVEPRPDSADEYTAVVVEWHNLEDAGQGGIVYGTTWVAPYLRWTPYERLGIL